MSQKFSYSLSAIFRYTILSALFLALATFLHGAESPPTFELKWGTEGSGDGQFSAPGGVAVDSSGNVYVADILNNRIQKFDSSGNFLLKWGAYGSSDGQFSGSRSVAVDSSGNVYVTDEFNDRIQKFSQITMADVFGGESIDGFPGWKASLWYLNYNVDFWPCIYHDEHGWQFVDSGSTEEVIFVWDFGLGEWLFFNESTYRWLFLFGDNSGWIFTFEDPLRIILPTGGFFRGVTMAASSASRRDYPLIDWAVEVEHLSQLRYTYYSSHPSNLL